MIELHTLNVKDVDGKLRQHLWRCSYKNLGYLYSTFESCYENKKTKDNYIVYCLYKGKFAGWGLHNISLGIPYIMVYVYKKYRRKGIGRAIISKLTKNKPINKFYYNKDGSNDWFFNKLEKETK